MALSFFKQRDIDEMDVNDIPEEFINYFDSLDEQGRIALVGSRPDLAKALGLKLPEDIDRENTDSERTSPEESSDDMESADALEDDEPDEDNANEDEEDDNEELLEISQNYYAGKDLDKIIKDGMRPLEALAIEKDQKYCRIHHIRLEERNIKYRSSNGAIYGIILRICPECHRIFLDGESMPYYHRELTKRGIPHTFYDLSLTNRYLRTQIKEHEFSSDEKLFVPDTWIEENPTCPIHNIELFEIPCCKTYKDRKVRFTGYYCDKCRKIMVRRTAAEELEDDCAMAGVPVIEYEELAEKKPRKQPVPKRQVKPEYYVEDGKRIKYSYNRLVKDCYQLTEEDTVVVSDSTYCNLDGHETEQVMALIWIDQKRGGKTPYLFLLGYCQQCQKYYMDIDDYKVIYPIGRPEVIILNDMDLDYQVTSGQIFNLERDHLGKLEGKISQEIRSIKESADYVSPYATGDYDDGNLSYAKYISERKYGDKLTELNGYVDKPYSYRVDINSGDETETYYIGAADIALGNGKQVISANSDFGHELINYQTIKVHRGGKEYGIKLSRQFDIEKAHLYGYANLRTDEDQIFKKGITDPFLVRVLNMRKRQHNLTDIFVTIQENQNKIVNSDFQSNLVVQGCAGSGKTMVLLHRLSSLRYKRRDFDFSENAMILTPNDQFSLHIKGLANELQIGFIPRMSVEEYYIDILLKYDKSFKPRNKVVSEAIVQQAFVDYIYSDRFLQDFKQAYVEIIHERNTFLNTLNDLTAAMGQESRPISLEDDSRVVEQIQSRVSAMNRLVMARDQDVKTAKEFYEKLQNQKQSLEARLPGLKTAAETVVPELLIKVEEKITSYMGQQAHELEPLRQTVSDLTSERERVQGTFLMFGKRNRLNELDEQIQKATQMLEKAEAQFKAESELLSEPQTGKTDEEVLSWMKLVVQYIGSVREEIRTCNNVKESYEKNISDLAEVDQQLPEAKEKFEEAGRKIYGNESRRAIQFLTEKMAQYTPVGTYELIFEKATKTFRDEEAIKNIRGKTHRYDLYAQLLFALQYYGYANGHIHFMCVDEGQDLAINEYKLIKRINQNDLVFNAFGDINQLIKPGRGISDWSEFEKVFHAQEYELNENYRNTNQITKCCNTSFGMNVMQTGVDGSKVREIARKRLEEELSSLNITTQRIAILVPRAVQKDKYLKTDEISPEVREVIGDDMDNGHIALMYVDEVKGIEFDKVFVISNGMTRNEKYIAYTRALSDLIIVVDESIKPKKSKAKRRSGKKKEQEKNDTHSNTMKWGVAG